MERERLSDAAPARWPERECSLSASGARRARQAPRRSLPPRSAALAGLLAGAALVSAACSGNHRPATSANAGPPIERGAASWYGPKFDGHRTASGERYDMHGMTAAHPSLPFGTLVQVTNLANGRQVVVRINDRGPFAHRRIIDLSYAAAHELRILGAGTARVELAIVGRGDLLPPPIVPSPPLVLAAVSTAPSAAATTAAAVATEDREEPPVEDAEPREVSPATHADNPIAPGLGARFTVQVGAFGEPERADALQHDLLALYPDAVVHSDGAWSRVQIGLFAVREEAEALRRQLAAAGIAAVVVTAR